MSEKRNYNTPYDDAFKTLLDSCPKMIIPVVNELFGENFTGDEEIVKSPNEYFLFEGDGEERKIAPDSVYTICGTVHKKYHIECQSTVDGSMLMRIFEYDAQVALDDAKSTTHELVVRFPHSAIIYLRDRSTTPDECVIRIETPGDSASYTVPILKVQRYTAEELFSKNLLFLLPFHIFKYENLFDKIMRDETAYADLVNHFSAIRARLDEMGEAGELSEFDKQAIVDMSKKVIRAIGSTHGKIREVGEAMGGVVLDFEAKRILKEGEKIGEEIGREIGEKNRAISVARKMLAAGESPEKISEYTDLKLEEIAALAAEPQA